MVLTSPDHPRPAAPPPFSTWMPPFPGPTGRRLLMGRGEEEVWRWGDSRWASGQSRGDFHIAPDGPPCPSTPVRDWAWKYLSPPTLLWPGPLSKQDYRR